MSLINRLGTFVRRDKGQDLLEYALLVTLLVFVAIAAVGTAGVHVDTLFTDIVTRVPS
jgi:Flp pilus assembly pilin Flp